MARTFAGAHVIVLSPGVVSANGPHSSLLLVNPTTLTTSFEAYWGLQATTELVATLATFVTGTAFLDLGSDSNGDASASMGVTAGVWQWLGHSKATGTVTVKLHRNVIGSATWTHTTTAATFANDASAITSITLGAADTAAGSPRDCDEAVFAWWNRQLTDPELEWASLSLAHMLSTNPDVLVVLDQDAVTQKVPDLSGHGSNESSRTGTTVSTLSVPDFSYGAHVLESTRQPAGGAPAVTVKQLAALGVG